jgi:LysR family transcriptional regulator, glycine cleavage system transcriptional activator
MIRPELTLPSLNALLAFEAAARHGSFTRAAAELCVTQTAVSHQVKALEEELGVTLFKRTPQRVALTPAGRAWASELSLIFGRLRAVNLTLRRSIATERPHVSVSIVPSFGARWLVPRLGRFFQEHPDVDVRLSANERLVDFALEPVDIGIRYGSGRYPGLTVSKLAEDSLVVVAAPTLLAKARLATPRDLERHSLLHDDHPNAWEQWFLARKMRVPQQAPMNEFTDSAMLVEAVILGQGVGLSRWSLVADEIRAGRVQLAFPRIPPMPTGLAYYLVSPRENLRRREVAAFREWVLREAKALVLVRQSRSP